MNEQLLRQTAGRYPACILLASCLGGCSFDSARMNGATMKLGGRSGGLLSTREVKERIDVLPTYS